MAKSSVKEFLKRKNVNITVRTYLIDALGAMAFGLFASLLIGTIFGTLGRQLQIEIFNVIADYAKSATGAALGIAIAHALKAPQLVLFSAATVGIAGNALGGPVGALVATIVAAELGKIVSRETRLDIIVTPGITIISGVLVAQFVGPGVAQFMNWFGNLVKTATEMQPFIMGKRSKQQRTYLLQHHHRGRRRQGGRFRDGSNRLPQAGSCKGCKIREVKGEMHHEIIKDYMANSGTVF